MSTLEDALRKVPPQSLEAEESVLGGILLDSHALDRVIEVMGPDDFYRETNRKIFLAMLALTERGEPIDLITLTDTLKARDELHGEILDRIGADKVVYPEHEAGLRISHTFISHAILDYVEVVPGYGVSKIRVPDRFVGRSLQVLGLDEESGLRVLMIGRNKSVIYDPYPSERLQDGDVLMLVGEDRYLSEMEL